jgi:hypothetical protein
VDSYVPRSQVKQAMIGFACRFLVPIKRESDQIGQNILNQGAAASAS